MAAASVTEVWRYPAKSMQGESLPGAAIATNGIAGDRGWAVRDEKRGGIRGAKKIGGLMNLAARYRSEPSVDAPPPPIEIDLGDGQTVSSDGPDVNARLSGALDHYRRGAGDTDDLDAELRSIFSREPDEPLPDLSVFPTEIFEFESPPGTYFDALPILVITRQSLASLAALAPDSRIDVRRFRPNIVIDAADDGDTPWPELGWMGRTVRVGPVELDVVAPCPRCVMITRAFADLPQDRGLMRTVVRDADQVLGVYATVRTPGNIQTGDAFTLI